MTPPSPFFSKGGRGDFQKKGEHKGDLFRERGTQGGFAYFEFKKHDIILFILLKYELGIKKQIFHR